MSSSVPSGRPRVYLDTARALSQVGDAEAMNSMLPMLLELLDKDLPEINRLMLLGDARGANPMLHSLKGCMPIFCQAALCEELARVEVMSKAPASMVDISPAYEALQPKLLQLREEVAQYLSELH